MNSSFGHRKTKRPLPQSKYEKVTAISIQGTTQNDSGNRATEGDIERYFAHPIYFFLPVTECYSTYSTNLILLYISFRLN
jgi:hypothetical protein